MGTDKNVIQFTGEDGTFVMKQPENYSFLYFPLAGEKGIKASVTPNSGGDIKLNQNAFVLEPVSSENLHNNRSGRNFWCHIQGVGAWSVTGASAEEENKKFTDEQDESEMTAGLMWQTVTRHSKKYQMAAKVHSFVPLSHNVEIMQVELRNESDAPQNITPVAAVPIYGRSADNIRDHRHVTSLLNQIRTTEYGVYVKPSLSFDERGHQKNHLTYFVCGISGNGEKPVSFYPTVQEYIGEGGTFTHPFQVLKNEEGVPAKRYFEGKEALGGIRFTSVLLQSGESATYTVLIGVTEEEAEITDMIRSYATTEQVYEAWKEAQQYWQEMVNVKYDTGNARFDNFMRWVSFQPILRRIYGCSFLPHHDYGRGGRGWRDLWQDCLSLLIMDPHDVRQMILDNFGGVRIDGTNATIIGEKQGEFVADRNGIARVWMDHGVWPFITTKLYIDQTGDAEILKEKVSYFKDEHIGRGNELDESWDVDYGLQQKAENGEIYQGSVLEHLLLQHLCSFYEVGAHNHIRLRGADWNDALDMAAENGESVAFTCAYAGNLTELAELLTELEEKCAWKEIELLEEMWVLLQDHPESYESISARQDILERYTEHCRHNISGNTKMIAIGELADNLRHKAEWMKEHIRETEWISKEEKEGWFNSYYDNDKQPVEGYDGENVRMMLTGQVFAIMSGTAQKDHVQKICNSADHYLYDAEIGGYRLNTNFHMQKFNLGRMFGFAYGEKENGAVFSHMTVMYANALYQRGFVREGYQALQTLADTALHFEVSKIYPGIPEYFNAEGRGMYHYLTGAASWYMLTLVTEVFGVHGELENMVFEPKLVKEQFDGRGDAQIWLSFAGKRFHVIYHNPQNLDYGEYIVQSAACDSNVHLDLRETAVCFARKMIEQASDVEYTIEIELGER